MSVSGGYFRRQFYNLDVIDNHNLALTDWNEFTILTPNDPRLPLAGQPIVVSQPEHQQERHRGRQPAHLLGRQRDHLQRF